MSARGRAGRKLLVAAIAAAALGVIAAAAGPLREWAQVRRLGAALRTRDIGAVALGRADLAAARTAILRMEGRALLEGLDLLLAPRPGLPAPLGHYGARGLLDIPRAVLRAAPHLGSFARDLPYAGPLAFRVLLERGRPDLACPAPRETRASVTRQIAYVNFEYGGAVEILGDAQPLAVLARPSGARGLPRDDVVVFGTLHRGTSVADLGALPLAQAAPPPDADPRWHTWRTDDRRERPRAIAGHAYIFRSEGDASVPGVVVALEVLAVEKREIRLRWRLLSGGPAERTP